MHRCARSTAFAAIDGAMSSESYSALAFKQSDVDLLAVLRSDVGLVALAGVAREIGDIVGVDVDVVPADSLKPGMRGQVLAEPIPL